MADSYENGNLDDTNVIELIGKIMVVAIGILFFVVVFVFCLHLYAKWFWYRRQEPAADFAAGRHETTLVSALSHGLDPILLKTLPVVAFDPAESNGGPLECAVCLCEVSKGEKARLLPKCNHGFHLDCIDMWFQSHSTCPLCRNPVAGQSNDGSDELASESPVAEYPGFPTNVLFWGDESRVSAVGACLDESNSNHNQGSVVSEPSSSSMMPSGNRADGVLVIDVPRQMSEEEEPKSPMPARLRSLKRLLSGNNRRVNPSSPRCLDLEQGGRSGQS